MSEVFLRILNMSISASWLVLAVLLLRLLLKKVPKWVSVLLWGLVAVRLICPFSFESVFSLIPSAETVSPDIMMSPTPEIHTGISALNSVVNPIISESFTPEPLSGVNPLQIWISLAAVIWLAGITVMLIYTAVSYLLLRRKVATAVLLRDNIFQSEKVISPFVLGIIRPKIYLPFQMDEQSLEYVIAHEDSHIRRKDHWWKPFGFVLLALHWFNPLMWLGYILLCRDIELACDEKVIREMDSEAKADYTQALVACSVSRRSIAACPLAFGEVGVKIRVKSVMNYKKPTFWIIITAIVICMVVAVCFLTNPRDSFSGVLPEIHSHAYAVEEVAYEGGMYDFTVVVGENSPIYAITEDMTLVSQKEVSEEGIWAQLGELKETELTKENFDDLFRDPGNWVDNVNAKSIRNNTEGAWQLIYNQDVLYYVLQQKNGDLYLAYGYTGFSNNDTSYAHIRWLFKLAIDTTGSSGIIAKSGDSVVPMLSFPRGTVIADYADSVCWLMIDPGEEFVPFTAWRDGEEIRGVYTAYDAETFEPLKHLIPSGLDPQTYLFQNADPTRSYIVLATFSTESDAEIYAFGAKFQEGEINSADSSIVETINGELRTYYKNSDGTWQYNGRIYQYRLEITGRMPNAAVDSTFVYLSNLKSISFARAWRAAGLSSNLSDYFSPEEAVLVEWTNNGSSSNAIEGNNDQAAKPETELDAAISEAIRNHHSSDKPDGLLNTESHVILVNEAVSGTPLVGQTGHIREQTVYVYYLHQKFSVQEDRPEERTGIYGQATITFAVDETGKYTVKHFVKPESSADPGVDYSAELIKKFVSASEEIAENEEKYNKQLLDSCRKTAADYLENLKAQSPTQPGGTASTPLIGGVSYDIDGDGIDEMCTLTYGPTSGVFSFSFYASSMEATASGAKYTSTYALQRHYILSFDFTEDGTLRIKGETTSEPKEVVYFDIAVSDGKIVLQCEEEELFFR